MQQIIRQLSKLSLLCNAADSALITGGHAARQQFTSLRSLSWISNHRSNQTASFASSSSSAQADAAPLSTSEAPSSTSTASGQGSSVPPPWTPTKDLTKRKALPKRMGHMLQLLEKERVEAALQDKKFPEFKSGDVLEIKMSIPENKRRTTTFKGVCIAKFNKGWRTSFTVRNFIGSTGGIERTFPLFSPHLIDIKVLESSSRHKYRRSKLYYLRDRQPKEYKVT